MKGKGAHSNDSMGKASDRHAAPLCNYYSYDDNDLIAAPINNENNRKIMVW
jgi:hypothetical protein